MIKKKGDLFTSTSNVLGHGVNTKGLMGAGIAKMFREEYRQNYENYKYHCETRLLKPGGLFVFWEKGKYIFNFASQNEPGADARYEWALESMLAGSRQARALGHKVIAIPLIGCGIGGLEWEGMEKIVQAVELSIPEVEYEVWKYE